MRLNLTSELNVITIWNSRELPLFNFERLDILCAWIWPLCEKLWQFEFLESFRCSISCISIYYAPASDLRVNNYDHLNCSIASIVQFRASLYVMRLNRTSELKVMTIWISRELPLFNFKRLDILCDWIGPPSETLWPFELLNSFHCSISSVSIYYAPESDIRVKSYYHLKFLRASVVEVRASRYIMRLNWTSEWKVMTIWISRELSLFNFERLNILCTWIGPLSAKLWPFVFLESFHCSIPSVSIYYAPETDLRVKSYDHLNISRACIVQFRASWCIMRLNRTSELKVITIWNCWELPLLKFGLLDILCAWIGPPSEKLWPYEFLESFRCSISSVSIYDVPESDLRWKVMTIWISWKFPLFNFERLDILCSWIWHPS